MPMVNDIGELKWRGTVLVREEDADSMGGNSGDQSKYSQWRTLWGKMMPISERDIATGGQTVRESSCKFIVKYNIDLYKMWQLQQASNTAGGEENLPPNRTVANLRLLVEGQTYDVTSITDPDMHKKWLQLTLKEVWSSPAVDNTP